MEGIARMMKKIYVVELVPDRRCRVIPEVV
jgi:hypothetical protein